MQEKQRQDALTQQQYDNTASERAYQDALKQQAFNNNVTSQKLNIAKGEWALKQANARQKAAQAAGKAAAAGTKSGSSGSGGKATGSSGSASGGSRSTVSAGVRHTAHMLLPHPRYGLHRSAADSRLPRGFLFWYPAPQ